MKLELKNAELFESIEQNTDMALKSVVIGDIHHFNQAVENLADLKQTSKGEIEFFYLQKTLHVLGQNFMAEYAKRCKSQ